jgi:hypothetical protein
MQELERRPGGSLKRAFRQDSRSQYLRDEARRERRRQHPVLLATLRDVAIGLAIGIPLIVGLVVLGVFG